MAEPRKRTTAQRGYGTQHEKLRARWAPRVAAGVVPCARCGMRIPPGAAWDLDHDDDRRGYRGPAHASCNRSAGAAKGNAMRAPRAPRRPIRSRPW